MFELPLTETCIFIAALFTYFVSAILGLRQLSKNGVRSRQLLLVLVAAGVLLEIILLMIRSASIKALPMTGLFESMIILTVVFGLTFLSLSAFIRQVWFSSVMVWIVFIIAVLSAVVATPAVEPHPIAQRPWVILHGLSMLFSIAGMALAGAGATLFLLGRRSLKRKQISKVLGRMPNIEKLEKMNLTALKACFVFMTFGVISGFVVAAVRSSTVGIEFWQWFVDAKVVLMALSWMLVGAILALRSVLVLKSRTIAQITIIAFVLILFAVVGTAIFCGTAHDFSGDKIETVEQ